MSFYQQEPEKASTGKGISGNLQVYNNYNFFNDCDIAEMIHAGRDVNLSNKALKPPKNKKPKPRLVKWVAKVGKAFRRIGRSFCKQIAAILIIFTLGAQLAHPIPLGNADTGQNAAAVQNSASLDFNVGFYSFEDDLLIETPTFYDGDIGYVRIDITNTLDKAVEEVKIDYVFAAAWIQPIAENVAVSDSRSGGDWRYLPDTIHPFDGWHIGELKPGDSVGFIFQAQIHSLPDQVIETSVAVGLSSKLGGQNKEIPLFISPYLE